MVDGNGHPKENKQEQPGPQAQPEKKVLRQAAKILITKEGGVVVDSPLVKDAPAFLSEILAKANLGMIQKINQGKVKKSLIQKATSVPGAMQHFARSLGKKRF